MNKREVVRTDEQLYEELIGKVMKIDANAALYMATAAKELDTFKPTDDLASIFVWNDTLQGHSYWVCIFDKLHNL